MKNYKGIKIEIKPTAEQIEKINRTITKKKKDLLQDLNSQNI